MALQYNSAYVIISSALQRGIYGVFRWIEHKVGPCAPFHLNIHICQGLCAGKSPGVLDKYCNMCFVAKYRCLLLIQQIRHKRQCWDWVSFLLPMMRIDIGYVWKTFFVTIIDAVQLLTWNVLAHCRMINLLQTVYAFWHQPISIAKHLISDNPY